MSELIEQAQGHVWKCRVSNENKAREVEQRYHVSAKQLTSDGLLMKIISSSHPDIECWPCEASLEDAYIYLSNIKLDVMPDDGKEKSRRTAALLTRPYDQRRL